MRLATATLHTMTTRQKWLWLTAFILMPLAVLAQTNTPPDAPGDLPKTLSQYWDLAIAAVTPLLVTGISKVVPKLPKWVLPTVTPVIGIGLGLLINWLASANLGWVDMAKAGALAVFVREVINQAITKRLATPDPATPKP